MSELPAEKLRWKLVFSPQPPTLVLQHLFNIDLVATLHHTIAAYTTLWTEQIGREDNRYLKIAPSYHTLQPKVLSCEAPTSSQYAYAQFLIHNRSNGETLKAHVTTRNSPKTSSVKYQLTIPGGLLQILRPTHSKGIPWRRLHLSSRLLAMGQT